MFKKKPTIKPLAPLRSSERRRIADQIIAEYGVEIPPKPEDDQPEQSNDTATLSIGVIRNGLLPENSQSARFTTTAGKDLKQVSGTVYVGAHPAQEQRVLWIKIEEKIIPTVYTLWKNPGLVPLLHTPDIVLQKLRGGADLMTPGLARGPPFPSKATKGSVVAVASLEKPSVPIVVGVCEIDVAALREVRGAKGHAVRGEHWDSDEIWAWSRGGAGGGGKAPEEIEGWDNGDATDVLEDRLNHIGIENSDDEQIEGGVPLIHTAALTGKEEDRKEFLQGENGDPFERVEVEDKELSTKGKRTSHYAHDGTTISAHSGTDIDDIFWNALLYGLHHHRSTNASDPHHGLNFPVNQSALISNLVLPFLPITTPAQAATLNIKKTSWKNAKKFIKALEKAQLLKSKDRDGGECVVLDVDFEDSAVTSFVPYKLPKKDTVGSESGGGWGGKATSAGLLPSDASIGQKLRRIDLYKPKQQLAPVFAASGASHHALYLLTELRSIVNSYIESEELISDTNKRLINLNPILANAVFDGSTPLDREVSAKGSVPRDALIDRILKCCSPYHAILRNDESRDSVRAKAGHAPKILITLETRSGNKTVTKLSGVEPFNIHPQTLAEELQKSCASSTSVGQLAGSSPKKPIMEVMVQGPQKDAMIKALEKRGINKQWVEISDKTKGKKK
ncbi:MAG: hypothetical protein Q9182_002549 [Xanthomendoza sp. 2 TL-2023]